MKRLKEVIAEGNPLSKPIPQKFRPVQEEKRPPTPPEKDPFSFLQDIGSKKVLFLRCFKAWTQSVSNCSPAAFLRKELLYRKDGFHKLITHFCVIYLV